MANYKVDPLTRAWIEQSQTACSPDAQKALNEKTEKMKKEAEELGFTVLVERG